MNIQFSVYSDGLRTNFVPESKELGRRRKNCRGKVQIMTSSFKCLSSSWHCAAGGRQWISLLSRFWFEWFSVHNIYLFPIPFHLIVKMGHPSMTSQTFLKKYHWLWTRKTIICILLLFSLQIWRHKLFEII